MTSVRLLLAACLAAAASPSPAQSPAPAPAANQAEVPDPIVISRLIWSAMAALDQANQTGNYSVLRDLGAPSFQTNNSAATLGGIFEILRTQQIDLSYTLVVTPTLDFPPAIGLGGLLRVRGSFPLRPAAIAFDLMFQNVGGRWKIFGLAVAPIPSAPPQSAQPRR